MYSIVLKDGKTININATDVLWSEKARMIKLYNDEFMVARINMDNIAGWIDADYMAEGKKQKKVGKQNENDIKRTY